MKEKGERMMKQILYISILMMSVLFGQSNSTLLDDYWKISRAKNMFYFFKQNIRKDVFRVLSIKEEDAQITLMHEVDLLVNNPIYLKSYEKIFFSMNDEVIRKLNTFYRTEVGKRYSKIFIDAKYKTREDIKREYKVMMKYHPISEEKRILITNIGEELNLLNLKVDWEKRFTIYKAHKLSNNVRITDATIEKYIKRFRIIEKEYETMLMPVILQNFSQEELRMILRYASSKILAIEVEYIYNAAFEFSKLIYTDLKKDTERLIMIRFCQDYPTDRGFIPEDCKPEWINKR